MSPGATDKAEAVIDCADAEQTIRSLPAENMERNAWAAHARGELVDRGGPDYHRLVASVASSDLSYSPHAATRK